MPPIFKALVTISVWVLFIVGWLATLMTGITIASTMPSPPMVAVAHGAAGGMFFILACVAAKIRQGMK
jgi:hypothetical protein